MRPEDAVEPTKQDGVVYKVPCECGKVYIGEMGRSMHERIRNISEIYGSHELRPQLSQNMLMRPDTIRSGTRLSLLSATHTVGSVSSRECLDAPAILATFTAGRTGLVIVETDQSETSPLKFAGQNVRHNVAGFRLSLEISHF